MLGLPVQAASSGLPAQQQLQLLALLQSARLCPVQAFPSYDLRRTLQIQPGAFLLLSAVVWPVQAVQLRGVRGLTIHHGRHSASL